MALKFGLLSQLRVLGSRRLGFLSSRIVDSPVEIQCFSASLPGCQHWHHSQSAQYGSDETGVVQKPSEGGKSERDASRVSMKSSLSETELAKFSAVAETWWDAQGPFKPLHDLNPTRLAFIRSTLCDHFRKDPDSVRPFEGLKFLDVGCGGGILSEPLARMGASVTAVDAVDKNIKIARLHAESDPLTSGIDYRCTTAEKLVEENQQFDAVLSLEVIEHVANPAEFCTSLAELTVPNGATVISTINRTMRAYATTIAVAEYILHWLPKGTHEWSKFVTPEELALILDRNSIDVQEMAGFVYNPLSGRWLLSDDISVNYIAFGTRKASRD